MSQRLTSAHDLEDAAFQARLEPLARTVLPQSRLQQSPAPKHGDARRARWSTLLLAGFAGALLATSVIWFYQGGAGPQRARTTPTPTDMPAAPSVGHAANPAPAQARAPAAAPSETRPEKPEPVQSAPPVAATGSLPPPMVPRVTVGKHSVPVAGPPPALPRPPSATAVQHAPIVPSSAGIVAVPAGRPAAAVPHATSATPAAAAPAVAAPPHAESGTRQPTTIMTPPAQPLPAGATEQTGPRASTTTITSIPSAAVTPKPAPAAPAAQAAQAAAAPAAGPSPARETSTSASKSDARPVPPNPLTQTLLQRGRAALARGDVAAARMLFESAAEQGSADAAREAGTTYDRRFLAALGVRGVAGDARQAAAWYRRAIRLGDARAHELLREIEANVSH